MRGTNIQGQRPISAQFLAALSRSKLPQGVKSKSQHFAVVDLVITAGKGRKYGPDTVYLTEPTRLADENFSGLATTTESFATMTDGLATTTDGFATTTGGLAPPRDQVGGFALQGDSQMLGGNLMNLTGVGSYIQQIVMGLIIVVAVAYDVFSKRGKARTTILKADTKDREDPVAAPGPPAQAQGASNAGT